MAVSRRIVLLLLPALALAAGPKKKEKGFEGGTIKVVEMAVHRLSSDPFITIDGRIQNTGPQGIRGLVLIFEVIGTDGQVVSRQRGKVDEDPLGTGEESEVHWQMSNQSRAVEVQLRAVAHDEQAVKVEEPGPYAIE